MWLNHPSLLIVPIVVQDQYVQIATYLLPSKDVHQYGYMTLPTRGARSEEQSIWLHGYIAPAFLGSRLWGKVNKATHGVPSCGPQSAETSILLQRTF